ncbi:MAG: hypothetical protein LBV01_02000 [Deltaproteobacteria bacterium]|jgi:hypothetical protein|nr:hypothetical protein [Deltaproteobacteria bacterium]
MLQALKKILRDFVFAPPPRKPTCPHCGGVRCFGACQYPDPDADRKRARRNPPGGPA